MEADNMIIIPWNDEQYMAFSMIITTDFFSNYIEVNDNLGCTMYLPENIAQILKGELGHYLDNSDKNDETHKIIVEMYKQLSEELKASWYY